MTDAKLCPLSIENGHLVYRLLQRIPAYENGFYNKAHGMSFEEYKSWLRRCEEIRQGIDLMEGEVEESIYWLLVDDIPIGMGKIRHRLTPALKIHGGNLSYSITPQQRNKGYGTILLDLLLKEAKRLQLDEVLVTIYRYNEPSHQVIIKNGGILIEETDLRAYYRFDTL